MKTEPKRIKGAHVLRGVINSLTAILGPKGELKFARNRLQVSPPLRDTAASRLSS